MNFQKNALILLCFLNDFLIVDISKVGIIMSSETCFAEWKIKDGEFELFGNYIEIYDMIQAVEGGAKRPVYYGSRVIHLKIYENILRLIDAEYDI